MDIVNQLKNALHAAKQQAESEVREWTDLCVTKAVNGVVELSGEPLPASAELKKNVVKVFTHFEKSPSGIVSHLKNTAQMFVPAIPKSFSEVKEFKKKSAQIILQAAQNNHKS
jgi:uncharacterized membrane-anchored protein YhcB (DUF1043 family)